MEGILNYMLKCIKCNDIKDEPVKSNWNVCKSCRKEYRRENYLKNKERDLVRNRKYKAKNKEKVAKKNDEYYSRPEIIEKTRNYRKKYFQENRDKLYEKQKIYLQDPQHKITHNLRNRISYFIRKKSRSNSSKELLGCTIEFLIEYLEKQFKPGMSWDNYGKNGWHIDHIIPCCSFDLTNPEEQKKCFHYTNLQPLWAMENYRKNKY